MRNLPAALVLLAAACGGGGGGGDDGGSVDGPVADAIDAPTDAPEFDPARHVRITVRDRIDRPIAGADVWAHAAAGGSALFTSVTDANGQAIVEVPAGSSVTVHNRENEHYAYWRTVLAVAPGDELPFRMPAAEDYVPVDPLPTVTVPLTLPAPPAGTATVRLRGPCAIGSDPISGGGQLTSTCTGPVTVIATARDASNTVLGYLVLEDLTITAGVPVTTTATWDTAPPTWTLDVQHVPAGIRYVATDRYVDAFGHHEGGFFGHGDFALVNNLTAAGATRDAPRPAHDGPATYRALAGPWNGGYRFTLETNQQPLDRFTVDLDALPSPQPLQYSASGRDYTWTAVPGADLVALDLTVAEGTGDVIGPTSSWSVIGPPGLAAFEFLGDVSFPFAGTTTPATRLYSVGVRAWKAPWWPDYDQLRLAIPGPVQRPAVFTTTSSYDGFSIYNPES